uniref:NADP-dependent oxidoreductase domain-containing protein n=1 Tax=Aquila chrysaetos chrysaetos TaxID=223781 RepID=A0A663E997_AQUCH
MKARAKLEHLIIWGSKVPRFGEQQTSSLQGTAGDAVKFAIGVGYRHFDCAYLYQNENEIRDALREKIEEGIVRREDLFIVSKLPGFALPLRLWSAFRERSLVKEACQKTRAALQLDYLHLYLMHWPMGFKVLSLQLPGATCQSSATFSFGTRHVLSNEGCC